MDPASSDWSSHAACLGSTHKFFPPDRAGSGNGTAWSPVPAQRICARCPVAVDCLTYAVDAPELHGVWGGAGGDLLRGFRRLRRETRESCSNAVDCTCAFHAAVVAHLVKIRELIAPDPPARPRRAPHRNGPAVTHGRASTYARGCRCSRCRFRVSVSGRRLHDNGIDVPDWWDREFGSGHGFSTDPQITAAECTTARSRLIASIAHAVNHRLDESGRDVAWLARRLADTDPDHARQLCDPTDHAHLITAAELEAVARLLNVEPSAVLATPIGAAT